ncbi:MAG TPA: hypothetical protein VGL13_05080 [Polyangiaceae bacterium]|jgi:hypothetical protein
MRDAIVSAGVVLAFATLITVHVAIAFGLAKQSPRWRGAAALLVPPLAPYWALRLGMMVRGAIWLGAVVVYAVFRGLAAI